MNILLYQLLLVALGGALGAMARFLSVSSTVALMGADFPYGVLLVNVVGSLLAGVALVFVYEKGIFNPHHQALFVIGFLGAFTTFSAFSVDTIALLHNGYPLKAVINVLGNVVASIAAAALGVFLTRQF